MLKHKYRFHPNDYALGENEKFYSDMEAKGWRLVVRGVHWSKFESVEPSEARYRIEVVAPKFLEEPGMSDEQAAVFEDCGWEYVTYHGMIHVFRAPAGSDAPEFYADPRQQAATLKGLRRGYLLGWLVAAIILAVNLSLHLALKGSFSEVLSGSVAEFQLMWVRYTALFVAALIFFLWALYSDIRGMWYISRTYRRMRKGIPLDHEPQSGHLPHQVIRGGLWAAIACFLLLFGWQVIHTEKTDLPMETEEPYLLLGSMGYEGERTYLPYSDNESRVERSESLLAEIWMTREALELSDSSDIWMYQDVYRLKDAETMEDFIRVLMGTATFGNGPEEFNSIEASGLDGAWTSHGLEVIAYKGDLVTYTTCSGLIMDDGETLRLVISALAEKWQ